MKNLYILRHPETESNSIYFGTFEARIKDASKDNLFNIAKKFNKKKISRIFCSNQSRAVVLASAIGQETRNSIYTDSRLSAKNYGQYTLCSKEYVKKKRKDYSNLYVRWTTHSRNEESYLKVAKRTASFLDFILDGQDNVVLVTHENNIKVLFSLLKEDPTQILRNFPYGEIFFIPEVRRRDFYENLIYKIFNIINKAN